MPELPEVETIKNYLSPLLKDKVIENIEILRPQAVLNKEIEFKNALIGKKITDVSRIGKYLIFNLNDEYCFYSHLRMEGKYYLLRKDEPNSKYPKVIFYFNDNQKLIFDDMRCFGFVKSCLKNELKKEKEIAKLGEEPFYIKDIESFYKKVKNKKDHIKSVILDQSIISGLGNIYSDETLFKSNIHPKKPTYLISKNEWVRIIENASNVLNLGIKNNGSTIKSFKIGKDHIGGMQDKLEMYGKKHTDCKVCKRNIRFTRVNGRGTSYCPNCQKHDFLPLNVAITGPIGVGKSLVTRFFTAKGYKTYSCDKIVHDLYEDKEFISLFNKEFNFSFKNEISRDTLRDYFIEDEKLKKKIETFVHKIVIKKVNELIKNNKDILIVEVPLLYEAKMNESFDEIIIVTSKKSDELLKHRDNQNAEVLKKINSSSISLKHLNDADYIIKNDEGKEELEKEIDKIINKWKHYQS